MLRAPEKIKLTKEVFIENDEASKIEGMQFSMLSNDEVRKAAEADIWRGSYYDNLKKPVPNGLLEPKLGPANKMSGPCATCHANFKDCPGHYGSLTLALPVFHIGYFGAILEILKCICKSCSHILLNEKERKELLKKMRNPKLDTQRKSEAKKKMVQKCSNKMITCFRCGYTNGKVKKGSGLLIIHDRQRTYDSDEEFTKPPRSSANQPSILDPVKVLWLFKRMQDQDCELLYLNGRPDKLLITCLPVPPIALRPSVFVDGGMSNENDITARLKCIILANARLRQDLEESSSLSRALVSWEHLQIEVAQYVNSEARVGLPPADNKNKRSLSGLIQRLKGKQGRFRANLSGKRVEFTGRTVISPDPNLKITEVAVPKLMATILTYPERVTHHNIEKLKQCVCNGPKKYPGAKFITDTSGHKRDLSFGNRKRIADELKFGCIVDRHLVDGDVVLFNRQPSLHRMSIMCHRARIMPWRTLRFNESVCNPYNADFDGDEMNLHVPQSEEARTEALMLMGVQNNLCTPKSGVVLVASTQDFLTSSFLITRKDTFYDRAMFSLLCTYMGDGMDLIDLPTPAIIKPIELWTGKQLFNVLLRPCAGMRVFINLMVREKNYCKPDDRQIPCQEETMCPKDGFVYFRNSELISGQLGKATLGNGNKIGLYSVLLRDYNAHAAAACMTRLAKLSARWIGNHGFSIGIDDVQPLKVLNERKGSKILEGYRECDKLIQLYNKGELVPLPGCDSVQTLETKITSTLNEIRDTTSKVCMEELHWRNSPLIMSHCGSKGSPINISQMVACVGQQAVGGRRAPDGFIDRSLPHFPKNAKTPDAKGFVANSFYSGLTATEFFFHTMGGREGLVDTAVKTADTGYMARRLMKCLEDLSVQYDLTVRNATGTIVQFCYGDDGMDPGQMEGAEGFPVDFERLRFKVEATCPAGNDRMLSQSEVSEYIKVKITEYDKIFDGGCSHAFEKLQQFFDTIVAKRNVHFTEKQLQVFMESFISRLRSKYIEAGTSIGAIGAQSIAEPGTQMTLKTFHFAGVASMNVTLGVPRIKEIISASKKISTPVITAKLVNNEMEIAQTVKGCIEKTTLGQVSKSVKLVMTSVGAAVDVKLDAEKIKELSLCLNAHIVKVAIENFLKKRKDMKNLNVKVLDDMKLSLIPEAERSCLHFVLHWLSNRLPDVIVKGIKTVERAVVTKDEKKNGELQLFVEGTGLLKVMVIDGVDGSNTTSNDIMEVCRTLGIEASRHCIIKEIKQVMQSHAMEIDIRHMMLLADLMTFMGEVLAISRTGMVKMKDSVLMLASFEKTGDHLFNASVNGRVEKIEGVSECIIMGVPMRMGTGILKVMQRSQEVPELTYKADPIIC